MLVKIMISTILILCAAAVLYGYFGDNEGIEMLGVFTGTVSLLTFAEWAARQKK